MAKLKYEMITRWGEYEKQREIEVIYRAQKVEEIIMTILIHGHIQVELKKSWHGVIEGEWQRNEYEK